MKSLNKKSSGSKGISHVSVSILGLVFPKIDSNQSLYAIFLGVQYGN